ncbi:hypothetical protein HHI36_003021 [Cryptolaemus montrouzieri]|uniref:Uncharacterized protein n=1 Tax=Cryptolaemus montrouzieri TaxID=559131 RepID=A0ABD2PD06_9CUCU
MDSENYSRTTSSILKLRNISQFETTCAPKRIGRRTYTYLAPRICAALPEAIKKSGNIRCFKKSAKQWILETERVAVFEMINNLCEIDEEKTVSDIIVLNGE